MFQQLELDFASALDEPEQADVALMCASLDQYWQGRSPHEQLRVAGDAIKDMAEVCFQRSELMIQCWEERYNSEGPVLDEDFLAGMVQQTMLLDLSDLCRQPKSLKRLQVLGDRVRGKTTSLQITLIAYDTVTPDCLTHL